MGKGVIKMKSAINWFDIPTLNFKRAVRFYSEILGETIKTSEFMGQRLGLFPMDDDGEVGGDIVPPSNENKPSKDGTGYI